MCSTPISTTSAANTLLRGLAPVSQTDAALGPSRFKRLEASLFEDLLLFDRVSFKVHGENIPLAVLLNLFGTKSFEALFEQSAIRFVLWTPMVGFNETELPWIHPLVFGNFNSPAHSNPEASADLGLKWLRNPPSARYQRLLIKRQVHQVGVDDGRRFRSRFCD